MAYSMYISYLSIRNLRNLESIEFYPAQGLNILSGANGSGKTSLLEAIYLLGLGRSFRSSQLNPLIQVNTEAFRVIGKIEQSPKGWIIGVEFNEMGFQARINGHTVKKRSQLAAQLPLLYLPSYSHIIVDGGPRYRRQWIDWVGFHVEPHFRDLWWRYQRILKQRNHALRSTASRWRLEIAPWNKELAAYGERITLLRESVFAELKKSVSHLFGLLMEPIGSVRMELKRGWAHILPLEQALKETQEQDRVAGYTRYGPHRAEVVFYIEGKDIRQVLSRGQQKVFCYALALAQVELLRRAKEKDCLFLVDDFTSELDVSHRNRILMLLNELAIQTFVTTVETIDSELEAYPTAKQFHIKRGKILKMV